MPKQKEEVVNLKSDLKGLSDLIGSFSNIAIHAVMAASQTGKTTLALQLLYEHSHKTGKNGLIYDTEGGAQEFVDHWDSVFRKRYPNAKKIFVITCREYEDILKQHGWLAIEKDDPKSTKVSLTVKTLHKGEPSEIEDFVIKNDIGMIVYDSFTMPMKYFGSEQQNFPARNTAQSAWLQTMMKLIDRYRCVVIANHHTTKNPTDPYAIEQMSGGQALQYASKVIIYMKRITAKGATNYRRVQLRRHFFIKDFDDNNMPERMIKLMSDKGYVDTNEDEMEADKKKAKSG